MPHSNLAHIHILTDILPILWRRRLLICLAVVVTSVAGFLFYKSVGERYESYTLLRVGQGLIKDRSPSGPFAEGLDLTSRIESLARIATTDQVIRLAAFHVGFDRLFKKPEGDLTSTVREWMEQSDFLQAFLAQFSSLNARPGTEATNANADVIREKQLAEVAALHGLISAKAEGRTDLLKISFRHRDPVIAAEFLNQLANALVATQADLLQVPGAQVFFQQQAKRLEAEAEKAAADLRNFSVAASIYSVADQRTLLLKRADDLGNLVASTRGAVEDRRGQKQAILDQLMILRPVYQSRTVTGIVNNLRGRDHKDVDNSVGTAHNEEAPPLLLVKVYQDAMANLLKVNTDLNGSLRVEQHLVSELEKVNAELASLSSREAEYDRLKRVLTRASAAADNYGSRVIEEDINQDIAKKTQLSSVRVVQSAEQSITPVFPRAPHIAVLAVIGGITFGSAFAVMLELGRARRRYDAADRIENVSTIEEAVRRSVRGHLREIKAAE